MEKFKEELRQIIATYDSNLYVCQLPAHIQKSIIKNVSNLYSNVIDLQVVQSVMENRLNNLENLIVE